jgi:multidrug resistance efflux pump
MMQWVRNMGYLVLALSLAGCDREQQSKPSKPEDKPVKTDKPAAVGAKAPTRKVERGPFKIEVALKGIIESGAMIEVSVRTDAWFPNPLIVEKVVDHGTPVKKGDPILWLELDKINQMIHDLEADRYLAELAIKQAEEELPVWAKTTPLDLTLAERARTVADEDLKKFLEVERPFSEKLAHFQVKSAHNMLDYVKEELRQLEKMYRARDIREETEEIILKRQRNAVEEMTFYVRMAELRRDQTLNVRLPRQEQDLKEAVSKQEIALDRARATLPLALNQKRLTLNKMKYDRERSSEKLRKLQKDRDAMTVKAAADGIVYYGKCVRGQWTTGLARLQRGGMLQPEEVALTIVQPRPIFVRAVVNEKDLQYVRPGLKGKVVLASDPDGKLPAKVDQVSTVPVTAGVFDAKVSLDGGSQSEQLMPGMACTVKLVPYVKENTLTIPTAALMTDDIDDDKHFVYLARKEGEPEKKSVKIGKRTGDKVEILEGVDEGAEVLLEKPGAAPKTTAPEK